MFSPQVLVARVCITDESMKGFSSQVLSAQVAMCSSALSMDAIKFIAGQAGLVENNKYRLTTFTSSAEYKPLL